MELANNELAYNAVSYTHLDVYKRQVDTESIRALQIIRSNAITIRIQEQYVGCHIALQQNCTATKASDPTVDTRHSEFASIVTVTQPFTVKINTVELANNELAYNENSDVTSKSTSLFGLDVYKRQLQ